MTGTAGKTESRRGFDSEADVAIFSLEEGDFQFIDALKQTRVGHHKLTPVATVKAGKLYGSASIPVEG